MEIFIALWLSQNMTVDKVLPILNSERIPCNQTTWMQAFTAPLYSTYAEDNGMEAFFFLDQKMGPPPNMNTYLEVEFRSMESHAQSESVKPTNSSSESAA